jgi:hypothetical protein
MSDNEPLISPFRNVEAYPAPIGPMPMPPPPPPIPPGGDRSGIPDEMVTPVPYVQADDAGRILSVGVMAIGALKKMEAHFDGVFIQVEGPVDYKKFYVDVAARKLLPRQENPAKLDGMTLLDLPVPCEVTINNPLAMPSRYQITESPLALSFEYPGTYDVRVKRVGYLDAFFMVTVPNEP